MFPRSPLVWSAPMRAALATLILAACGPGERTNPAADATPGNDATVADGAGDGPVVDASRIYAHAPASTDGAPDVLYRINAQTFAPEQIGPITGFVDPMQNLQDLAVDSRDQMYGVTVDKLYKIDPATGAASQPRTLQTDQRFSSLSFVPASTAGQPDILITANGVGDVFLIDVNSGTATEIGNYGADANGDQISSSGDIVAIEGLGIFATVNVGNDPTDYLASINRDAAWKATIIGPTGFDRIFGLGFWAGKLYGLVGNPRPPEGPGGGIVIEINPQTGVGTQRTVSTQRWFGAGVATNAPIL